MINANLMKVVGETLEAHSVKPRAGEYMGDTVARALHVSGAEAERWLEALSEGCTVAEANTAAGIPVTEESAPILVAIARSIGTFVGNIAAATTDQPLC